MDFLLILIIVAVPLMAHLNIKKNYNTYLNLANQEHLKGEEVARKILDRNGLENVAVVAVDGILTDHYDPKEKVVRLSRAVYENPSIASLAIAAHECGHAIQDKESYAFLRIRSAIYPVVNITTSISYYILLFGFIFGFLNLMYAGIAFTVFGLLFQVITLPVEFNASNRAKKEISELYLAVDNEMNEVNEMLTSAALTYVAGVMASILQIVRLIMAAQRNNR